MNSPPWRMPGPGVSLCRGSDENSKCLRGFVQHFLDERIHDEFSFGQSLADRVAVFRGSWSLIMNPHEKIDDVRTRQLETLVKQQSEQIVQLKMLLEEVSK